MTNPTPLWYNTDTKREELRAMKNSNYGIKGYAMGNYKYEYGTQLPWQREMPGMTYTVKSAPMTKEEMVYWQKFFQKKYNGQFAKMR